MGTGAEKNLLGCGREQGDRLTRVAGRAWFLWPGRTRAGIDLIAP